MHRILVVATVLCGVTLLALQVFVSLQPVDVQATSHSVNITGPTAGSWQKGNFQVQYDAQNVSTCEVWTNDGGAGWTQRTTINSCTSGSTAIQVGLSGWCSAEGLNQCGVRVTGSPPPAVAAFNYTSAIQTWTVPPGVTEIMVDVKGAQGHQATGNNHGRGGRVQANISVTPGENLSIHVGGAGSPASGAIGGAGGFNGGGSGGNSLGGGNSSGSGGGGASDIRQGGNALADRIVVAGGGGGSLHGYVGGAGGGLSGVGADIGGTPSSQSSGGSGGSPNLDALPACGNADPRAGSSGTLSSGGAGAFCTLSCCHGGSGGGGGYYGGGGGGNGGWQGGGMVGGGGSGYPDPSNPPIGVTNISHTQGFQTGDGQVIIAYTPGGVAQDEEFFSIDYTVPTASFNVPPTPADGSDLAADFQIQYDADDAFIDTCTLSSSTNGGGTWTPRSSACGANQTEMGLIPGWCSAGVKCSIRIWARDLAGNIGEQVLHFKGAFTGGLVPCGRDTNDPLTAIDESQPCTLCHGFVLVHNVIEFFLLPNNTNNGFALVMLLGALMLVVGGFSLLVGGLGNPALRNKGRQILFTTIIALLIIYGSWVALNMLFDFLGASTFTGTGNWWQVTCGGGG
ncbi:MAG TPA: glycine-rich protein [Candidatus Paceibacterota bacterium]